MAVGLGLPTGSENHTELRFFAGRIVLYQGRDKKAIRQLQEKSPRY